MKCPVRLANMETISVLNDEKPAFKAAILNLPRESVLGVQWNCWVYLTSLVPTFTDSPLGPFIG